MIGIVIVAHGGLAREYLAAVEHVVGKLEGVRTVAIEGNYDRASKEAEIRAAAEAVDEGEGVVVVTDMFGGSPCNLSFEACRGRNRRFLHGANLPMLIKLAKSRQMPMDEAANRALVAGRKYIDCINKRTGKRPDGHHQDPENHQ